jgi:hypothetical protein
VVLRKYLIVVSRPLPPAPLVVRRRHFIAVLKPLPAAPPPKPEKKQLPDVQRTRANVTGFICIEARWPSRCCIFDGVELLALASRRARHRWRLFKPLCHGGRYAHNID